MSERAATAEPALPLAGVDVAVLVGGRGTRLGTLAGDGPKPLAPILGRPFLFYVLDLLALRGARRVVLCAGYRADRVREAVGETWCGMEIRHAVETTPLGTGGALVAARAHLESAQVLVINGDTWLEPDWRALLAALREAPVALAAVQVADAGRFGSLEVDARGRVTAFREKSAAGGAGRINGGVYALRRAWLDGLPTGPCSLEQDLWPRLVAAGELAALATDAEFLDIGVPESFAAAESFFTRLGLAPNPMFPDRPPAAKALPKLGACAFVVDERGRVLLERRADCGWWCCPGGKLDAGETLEQTVHREVREETGLEIEVLRFLGVFSDPTRRTVRYPDNGDVRQLVDVAVLARVTGGELRRSAESLDLQWFPPGAIPCNTCPPVTEAFRAAFLGSVGLLR
jgi:D-glycero-alpha-D-manno-heptose 1-phosphate guanylyltransferase